MEGTEVRSQRFVFGMRGREGREGRMIGVEGAGGVVAPSKGSGGDWGAKEVDCDSSTPLRGALPSYHVCITL
jgi:hypothetical protein